MIGGGRIPAKQGPAGCRLNLSIPKTVTMARTREHSVCMADQQPPATRNSCQRSAQVLPTASYKPRSGATTSSCRLETNKLQTLSASRIESHNSERMAGDASVNKSARGVRLNCRPNLLILLGKNDDCGAELSNEFPDGGQLLRQFSATCGVVICTKGSPNLFLSSLFSSCGPDGWRTDNSSHVLFW